MAATVPFRPSDPRTKGKPEYGASHHRRRLAARILLFREHALGAWFFDQRADRSGESNLHATMHRSVERQRITGSSTGGSVDRRPPLAGSRRTAQQRFGPPH